MDTLPEDIELEDIDEEDLPTNTLLAYGEQIEGMDDSLEAMRQAVHIILNTKRVNYQIYTENFGGCI